MDVKDDAPKPKPEQQAPKRLKSDTSDALTTSTVAQTLPHRLIQYFCQYLEIGDLTAAKVVAAVWNRTIQNSSVLPIELTLDWRIKSNLGQSRLDRCISR